MYESYFELARRPFSATPDASCCFPAAGNFDDALDELMNGVESGQGIGVLTAPAGLGKTLLCQKLALELAGPFQPVLLSNANFPTRRSLLQAVLYELGHPYNQMGEQELRLALTTAVKDIGKTREAVAVILDEAHLLNDRLLEEIRTLTNLAENGRPLMRFVLCGQLSLEEKLTGAAFDAFNQRICRQVTLEPFTLRESAEYIAYRLQWAGGDTAAIFTPEAVDYIGRAGDGSPRCLNQLCDHSLLLAYVAEQKPAGVGIVREALDDLKQLPLHWNEPAAPSLADEPAETLSSDDRADAAGEPADLAEFPADRQAIEVGYERQSNREITVLETQRPTDSQTNLGRTTAFIEEVVFDRYALLDAGRPLPPQCESASRPAARGKINPVAVFVPIPEPLSKFAAVETWPVHSEAGDETLWPVEPVDFDSPRVWDNSASAESLELPVSTADVGSSPVLLSASEILSASETGFAIDDLQSAAILVADAIHPVADAASVGADAGSIRHDSVGSRADAIHPVADAASVGADAGSIRHDSGADAGSIRHDSIRHEGIAAGSNPGSDWQDGPRWQESTVDLDAGSKLAAPPAGCIEFGDGRELGDSGHADEDNFELALGAQALEICAETQRALMEIAERAGNDADGPGNDAGPPRGLARYDVVQPEPASSLEGETQQPQPARTISGLSLEPSTPAAPRSSGRSLSRLFSDLRRRQQEID